MIFRIRPRFVVLLTTVILLSGVVHAQPASPKQWSQFLGPQRNGISQETGLNLDWKASPPEVLWKVELGGGFSSMSFAERRLFTMAERGERIFVLAYDIESGSEVWSYDISPKYMDAGNFGAGPRATPTYHNGRLYCLSPHGDLVCLHSSGELVWKTDIFGATGAPKRDDDRYYWGMSASPLIEGNLVIVQPGGEENNSVAAFHVKDGSLVWSAGNDVPGYGSPIAILAAGRRQVICTSGVSIFSVDPKDGKLLWRFPWDNKVKMNSATPVWVDGLLVVSALHEPGAAALEIVEDGEQFVAKAKWHNEHLKTHYATSMVLDGYVYGTHGGGGCTLRCLDLQTGELKWADRVTAKSSLLAVGQHLIALSEDGALRVVEVSPQGVRLKGEMENLLEPKAWAAPALANGRLYVRDEKHLVCLDLR